VNSNSLLEFNVSPTYVRSKFPYTYGLRLTGTSRETEERGGGAENYARHKQTWRDWVSRFSRHTCVGQDNVGVRNIVPNVEFLGERCARHTWSSVHPNESIPVVHIDSVCPSPRPGGHRSASMSKACCPLPQGQPNAPREARGSSALDETLDPEFPSCPQADTQHFTRSDTLPCCRIRADKRTPWPSKPGRTLY